MVSNDCPEDLNDLFNPKYVHYLFEMARQNGAMRTLDYTYKGDGKKKTSHYVLLDPQYDWTGTTKRESLSLPSVGRIRTTYYDAYIDLNKLVKLAVEGKTTSFFDGDRFFIVSENVPEEFIRHVLYHELTESRWSGVGESSTMDVAYAMSKDGVDEEEIKQFVDEELEFARKFPHIRGCFSELESVFSEGEEFAIRYAIWLQELNGDFGDPSTFFNQAIPRFLEDRQDKSPLQSVVEFYLIIDHDYEGKRLVQKFPWAEAYVPQESLEDRIR